MTMNHMPLPSNRESGDEKARTFLHDVADVVATDKDTYGDAVENQQHIADGWTWYLRGMGVLDDDESLNGSDVGAMMVIQNLSRTAVGEHDVDQDRDICGYASISAACAVVSDRADDDQLTVEDLSEHE